MLKKTGAGCLAIAKSIVSVADSIACQTSRGAMVVIALIGVGLPVAVHAHHSPQSIRSLPRQTQTVLHACYTERPEIPGNVVASHKPMPCGTIEHLLQANLSLAGDRFIDDAHAALGMTKITLSLHGARPATS